MKASPFEYRFRFALHAILFTLGFWAPWNRWLHLDPAGPNAHVWGLLAVDVTRLGIGTISSAFNALLVVGIVCAMAAAALRTWGAAYLGASVVESGQMHTSQAIPATGILQDGPFRYVRNPLYLGTFFHSIALSMLMPRSGAIFTLVTIGLLQLRLIFAEESFLAAKLGPPYAAYCALVPRLFPTLRPALPTTGLAPRWPQAFLGEIHMWGVALSFAFAGWRYDAGLLIKCVIVSLGVSLIARALKPASAVAPA